MSEVVLKRMPADLVAYDANEPQYVKIYPNNDNIIALISDDRIVGTPYDFVVKYDGNPRYYEKLAVKYVDYYLSIPNINIRNNEINFWLSSSGLIHRAVIPPGFYDFSSLAPVLKASLDGASPAHGLTFTVTPNTVQNYYSVTVSAGTFSFRDCTMRTAGKYTMKLPPDTVVGSTIIIRGLTLHYTRNIWVFSSELNRFTKSPNYSSNIFNSQYFLVFTLDNPSRPARFSGIYDSPPNYIKFERSQSINAIDIKVYDDFGENPFNYGLETNEQTNDYMALDISAIT